MHKEFIEKLIFYEFLWVKVRTVLTQKKASDTETLRLVYNKFKIDHNYANKTR